jgi:putative ABC transport system substrate-binding protein
MTRSYPMEPRNKRRRLFLLMLGACVTSNASFLHGQPSRVRRIGILAPSTRVKEQIVLKPFFDEMRRLGWIDGQNIVYDHAYGNDEKNALPKLAAELVARKPDLIYAPPQPAALAAKHATHTIPIVFGTGTDPVGNVTGVISAVDPLVLKLIELLREVLPKVSRVGLLGDPTDPRAALDRAALAPVASALGITIIVAEASNASEFDTAVTKLLNQKVEAIVTNSVLPFHMRDRLVQIANQKRVPVVGHRTEIAEAGALYSYSASMADQFRRSAQIVDKVLNGRRPAELPVEQPIAFELVVNKTTAKELGIIIPQSMLLRAHKVIE